jgi:outer membrane PBP1 activator LpoA protein
LPAPENVKSYGLADDQKVQRLLKADTLIQAGDSQAARKELDLIKETELSPEQRGKFNLMDAQIALSMGDAEQAIKRLKMIRPGL